MRPLSSFLMGTLTLNPIPFASLSTRLSRFHSSNPGRILSRVSTRAISGLPSSRVQSEKKPFPLSASGVEEALMGFINGTRKSTEVAHTVWKYVVRKGDTVIDATCGNGHDTLALVKMVSDELGQGCVYAMDVQKSAIENTSWLLDISAEDHERKMVKLFQVCHSKMNEIVPKDVPVRLVAFNLGYLPGGDKTLITMPETTKTALRAASEILDSQGLISIVVYVGHPGGMDELEAVQSFACSLPAETWVSCKFEMINRPTAPILVLLFKK